MGVVINHPLDLTLDQVFDQLGLDNAERHADKNVLVGGPISRERGFILHPSDGREWESSLLVSNSINLTASRDILEAMAADEGPEHAQFILGYAGWAAGQLEDELAENGWLTVPADSETLFVTPIEQRWAAAARHLGVDISLISSQIGHA